MAVATGINNKGEVVGTTGCHYTRCAVIGFYWNSTRGLKESEGEAPRAINDLGQIAGALNRFPPKPVVWNTVDAEPQLLKAPTSDDGSGYATSINNVGTAAGYTYSSSYHAIQWSVTGVSTDIPASNSKFKIISYKKSCPKVFFQNQTKTGARNVAV